MRLQTSPDRTHLRRTPGARRTGLSVATDPVPVRIARGSTAGKVE